MKLLSVIVLLLVAFPVSAHIPEQENLEFEIYRKGKPFGMHTLSFSNEEGVIAADIAIEMSYELGPFDLFTYSHKNFEQYVDGKLTAMNAETDDNGKTLTVKAEANDEGIVVEASGEGTTKNATAPLTAMATTYWDESMLAQDALINSQYGGYPDITVTPLENTEVEMADGNMVPVRAYNFQDNKNEAVFYYDTEFGQWAGMRLQIRGEELVYKRVTPFTGNADYQLNRETLPTE